MAQFVPLVLFIKLHNKINKKSSFSSWTVQATKLNSPRVHFLTPGAKFAFYSKQQLLMQMTALCAFRPVTRLLAFVSGLYTKMSGSI